MVKIYLRTNDVYQQRDFEMFAAKRISCDHANGRASAIMQDIQYWNTVDVHRIYAKANNELIADSITLRVTLRFDGEQFIVALKHIHEHAKCWHEISDNRHVDTLTRWKNNPSLSLCLSFSLSMNIFSISWFVWMWTSHKLYTQFTYWICSGSCDKLIQIRWMLPVCKPIWISLLISGHWLFNGMACGNRSPTKEGEQFAHKSTQTINKHSRTKSNRWETLSHAASNNAWKRNKALISFSVRCVITINVR